MRGIVTKFFRKGGKKRNPYGFIEAEGDNYYFSMEKGMVIRVGDTVEFDPYWNDRGRIAVNVRGADYEGTNSLLS